jgi:hypothetical protein
VQPLFLTYWFVLFIAAVYPLYRFVPVRWVRLAALLVACVVFHTHFAGPAGAVPIVVLGVITYLVVLTRLRFHTQINPESHYYPTVRQVRSLARARSASAPPPEWLGDVTRWGPDLLAPFPEPDRKRTLIVCICDSPHYVDQLSSAEQTHYRAIIPSYLPRIERLGFSVLDVSDGWTANDFIDRPHLSGQGGRRLAELVAPKVRQMALELGYLKGGEP